MFNFRIQRLETDFKDSFYHIENINEKSFLCLSNNNEVIFTQNKAEESSKWQIINIKDDKYVLLIIYITINNDIYYNL